MAGLNTQITVMVIASNGKFLGADIGNALVTITDLMTGEILASGLTAGGSGDLKSIMLQPRERGTPVPAQGAATFSATLLLDRPRQLRFAASGPMAGLQSVESASVTQWVIPGKNLTAGNGILLTLTGLQVQVLSPATHLAMGTPTETISFSANVTMMCGCPINKVAPDGPGVVPLWDPSRFTVGVQIWLNGGIIDDVSLSFAGSTSLFTGSWTPPKGSDGAAFYTAVVYALESASPEPQGSWGGNCGCGTVSFFYMPPAN